MRIAGIPYRTIWVTEDQATIAIIDQTGLPWELRIASLSTCDEAAHAIRSMQVRGAPLIGVTAAYGLCLALRADPSNEGLERGYKALLATRPTAVNLRWALDTMVSSLGPLPPSERVAAAYTQAAALADAEVATCHRIGEHGLPLLEEVAAAKADQGSVNVLTHCNAGWLACVDWGTALAPIYRAHDAGLPIHVWVEETRPRNQGATLTAWELGQHGVPYTVIVDNAGGHLMQRGQVDLCLVGTDRTTFTGDVCNKIGTYLKALAAHEHGIPFYVALPSSTIDWDIADGIEMIPIEERDASEVTQITGRTPEDEVVEVALTPRGSPAANPAFDVTPAWLVTGLITERGVSAASSEGLYTLYPEKVPAGSPA